MILLEIEVKIDDNGIGGLLCRPRSRMVNPICSTDTGVCGMGKPADAGRQFGFRDGVSLRCAGAHAIEHADDEWRPLRVRVCIPAGGSADGDVSFDARGDDGLRRGRAGAVGDGGRRRITQPA